MTKIRRVKCHNNKLTRWWWCVLNIYIRWFLNFSKISTNYKTLLFLLFLNMKIGRWGTFFCTFVLKYINVKIIEFFLSLGNEERSLSARTVLFWILKLRFLCAICPLVMSLVWPVGDSTAREYTKWVLWGHDSSQEQWPVHLTWFCFRQIVYQTRNWPEVNRAGTL